MSSQGQNPLFAPQRETSGAITFSKYAYQYHWALFRVLQEHATEHEYAVFMEIHEDVVFANSLDEATALFEFNQIKTNKGQFNAKKLIKLENGRSILGKLIDNSVQKPYSQRLSCLNLVAVNGFNIPLKTAGLSLPKITLDDIHDDATKELTDAIRDELSIEQLPSNLHFIIPNLPYTNFQDLIIAELSKLGKKLFPNSYYDSVAMYRVLYDDIQRKGMVTYDFKNWQRFLKEKALTSEDMSQVIAQFVNLKDEGAIMTSFNEIAKELGMNSIQAKGLEKSFNRYRQARIGNKNLLQLDVSKEISSLLEEAVTIADNWPLIFKYITNKLSDRTRQYFPSETELKASIIYEFIILQ